MHSSEVNNIFSLGYDEEAFSDACLSTYLFQFNHNPVYRKWAILTGAEPDKVKIPAQIPSLPVSFFKNHKVITTNFEESFIFESSGTTQQVPSRHYIKDLSIYTTSFRKAFDLFYGDIREYCVLGLLPAYLERKNSSLVRMVDDLINLSGHESSGFYLYDYEKLSQTLQKLESIQQKTLLIGVSFALLDFAAAFPMQLQHTIVMETGGMKGRRKELTRTELHEQLKKGLGVSTIHSEYGMTELLSQAYSNGEGLYKCPPWMKVYVRDEEDPLVVKTSGRGILQIIDLANQYSCAFISTEDIGIVYEDGSFEVLGRMDNSEMRGCGLMIV